jgi:hypothetical protein
MGRVLGWDIFEVSWRVEVDGFLGDFFEHGVSGWGFVADAQEFLDFLFHLGALFESRKLALLDFVAQASDFEWGWVEVVWDFHFEAVSGYADSVFVVGVRFCAGVHCGKANGGLCVCGCPGIRGVGNETLDDVF